MLSTLFHQASTLNFETASDGLTGPHDSMINEEYVMEDRNALDSRISDDLADNIPGLFRILDLIHEQGSSGIGQILRLRCFYVFFNNRRLSVDKVLIAEHSFGAFMNFIMHGAYTSITKVDFKSLDQASITPVGLYGNSAEIVRYLTAVNAVTVEA
jgi:hypothetical protein